MACRRAELQRQMILAVGELAHCNHPKVHCWLCNCATITRHDQGFHLHLKEDETGIARVIVTPDPYEQDGMVMTRDRYPLVEGLLQNQDKVIHVKAMHFTALSDRVLEVRSHDSQ